MLRIGIVTGEPSGDALAAGLIRELRRQYAGEIRVDGVLGPASIKLGGKSLFPMSELSIMGIAEVASRYLPLTAVRNQLKQYFLQNRPDVFIGIDSPDFNLDLEGSLRAAGIPTIHYVSPSVWAWRPGRVKKVARSADMLLTLFPFEARFYEDQNIVVECVGHPLADELDMHNDIKAAREKLNIVPDARVIALMPGSRLKEFDRHAETFLQAARYCHEHQSDLIFVSNLLNSDMQADFDRVAEKVAPELPIKSFTGLSRDVMSASDAVLLASGTVTLEAMLLKRPMVIAYKLAPLSYYVLRLMVSSQWIGLPNILAQESLVPEYVQHDATSNRLGAALVELMNDKNRIEFLNNKFHTLHSDMKLGSDRKAAAAVLSLCHGLNP